MVVFMKWHLFGKAVVAFMLIALLAGAVQAEEDEDPTVTVLYYLNEHYKVEEPVKGDSVTLKVEFKNFEENMNDTYSVFVNDRAVINGTVDEKEFDVEYEWDDIDEGDNYVNVTVGGETYEADFEAKVEDDPQVSSYVIIFIACIVGIGFAYWMNMDVDSRETGPKVMNNIADAIKEGANAFLGRQYKTIAILSIVVMIIFIILIGLMHSWDLGMKTGVGFILGAACSGVSGIIGMKVAIKTNIRCAAAAARVEGGELENGSEPSEDEKDEEVKPGSDDDDEDSDEEKEESEDKEEEKKPEEKPVKATGGRLKPHEAINEALTIALRGGAVSGFAVVALSLIGVAGLLAVFSIGQPDLRITPLEIVGFGFGASFVALFAQLGGGIYTKAADVGADLVGKVEQGIPEDDPRNPAVIADLVGDNVGDCAGRGADLFESTAAENIGAMILGIALFPVFGINGILFPLVARSFGLIATVVGVFMVKVKEGQDPMAALNMGYYITAVIAILLFGVSCYMLLGAGAPYFWMAGIIGILVSVIFVYITQYYTEYKYKPVRDIAEASTTGAGTNIITGTAVAFESTAMPIIVISAALLGSYELGVMAASEIGVTAIQGGLYGTAVATMGMLATCAYILSMDTFGPITDNAGGIVEMSNAPEKVRDITDHLDAVGNTTKALTKGYAVGSAALAAFLLFSAYMAEAHLTEINLAKPVVFVGAMLGAMLMFLFSSFAIKAVGTSAKTIIEEVRRQFKENPDIMKYDPLDESPENLKNKPDYASCVDICTQSALKEMVVPGVLAVALPILVGLIFRAEAVGGTLMVGTIAGILLALVLNNGGGAWDNAKKYIETGAHGGKGSDAHKAAVVGDTVGDPFKDTAGPSLHVVVKLLSTITLVMAPLFI